MTSQEMYAIYEQTLRERNQIMNLVAESTLPDFKVRHIMDSEQLIKFIPKEKLVVDLGSGAGFPAVVLAIAGYKVIAIESIGKKTKFLEDVKTKLNLNNLTVITNRVEKIVPDIIREFGNKNVVFTARAFAPLIRIFEWTARRGNNYVLLKGSGIQGEITEAESKYNFEYELIKSTTGDGFVCLFHMK